MKSTLITDSYVNPTVIEERKMNAVAMDVFSRLLMDRIIFIGVPIDDDVANIVQAQMLFLAAQDPESDITLYINSPGGQVSSGLAIYDTMQIIAPDVATVCTGLAASMAALLLSSLAAPSQVVDISPDPAMLAAPFSAQDEEAFHQPPKAFWPETWFHFIGGNISKEGIDADLKAISDAGIAGIQWFHGHFGGQWPGTDEQVQALTPRWEELVGHLGAKTDSLGLRLTVQTCPGWAMAGGPWIQPEDAMRMLVWSRTDVDKAGDIVVSLPKGQPSGDGWRDYRDICVLAFPTPDRKSVV